MKQKPTSKSQMKRYGALGYVPDEPLCIGCAELMGGVPPTWAVTVWSDVCPYCKKTKTVVPVTDFAWPHANRKAIFD